MQLGPEVGDTLRELTILQVDLSSWGYTQGTHYTPGRSI